MYNTILVPVESSHIAESAATLELAQRNGGENCKIRLLNVFEEIPKWAAVNLPKHVVNDSIQSIEEEMQAVAKKSGANVETQIKIGHSYKTILEVADEIGAELIIVASNKPGQQNYLLGSTAAKVVRHARCSILVLR